MMFYIKLMQGFITKSQKEKAVQNRFVRYILQELEADILAWKNIGGGGILSQTQFNCQSKNIHWLDVVVLWLNVFLGLFHWDLPWLGGPMQWSHSADSWDGKHPFRIRLATLGHVQSSLGLQKPTFIIGWRTVPLFTYSRGCKRPEILPDLHATWGLPIRSGEMLEGPGQKGHFSFFSLLMQIMSFITVTFELMQTE